MCSLFVNIDRLKTIPDIVLHTNSGNCLNIRLNAYGLWVSDSAEIPQMKSPDVVAFGDITQAGVSFDFELLVTWLAVADIDPYWAI